MLETFINIIDSVQEDSGDLKFLKDTKEIFWISRNGSEVVQRQSKIISISAKCKKKEKRNCFLKINVKQCTVFVCVIFYSKLCQKYKQNYKLKDF